MPASSAWGRDVLLVQFARDRGDAEPCFIEIPDPFDDLFADLPRAPELDPLGTFHGERVPGPLTDQPALELRERGEHAAIISPVGVEVSTPRSRATRLQPRLRPRSISDAKSSRERESRS